MSSSGKRFGTLLEMNAGGKIVEAESVEEPARRATAAQMAARKIKQPKGHNRHFGSSSAHANRIKHISSPSSAAFSPTTPFTPITPTNGQRAQQSPLSAQPLSNPFSGSFGGADASSNLFAFTPTQPLSRPFQPFTPTSATSQVAVPPASTVSATGSIFSGISASSSTFNFSPAASQRPVSNPFAYGGSSGQTAGTSLLQFGASATPSIPKQQQTPATAATDSASSSLFSSITAPIKFQLGATPSMQGSQISAKPSTAPINNAGYSSVGGLGLTSGTMGPTPIDSAPSISSQQSTTSPFGFAFGKSEASSAAPTSTSAPASASPFKFIPDAGKSTTGPATSAGSQSYPPASSVFTIGQTKLAPPVISEAESSPKPATASISIPAQTQPVKFPPTNTMAPMTPSGASQATSGHRLQDQQTKNTFSGQYKNASRTNREVANLNEKINKDFETPHHTLSNEQTESLLDTSKFQPPPTNFTTDQTVAYVRDLRVRRLNEAFAEAMNAQDNNNMTDWTGMMVQYIKVMGMIQYSAKCGPKEFVFAKAGTLNAGKRKADQDIVRDDIKGNAQKTNAVKPAPLPTFASQTSNKFMGILDQNKDGPSDASKNANKFDSQSDQTPTPAKRPFNPVSRPSDAQAPAGFTMASIQPNPTPSGFTLKPTPTESSQSMSVGATGFTPKFPTTRSNQPTSTGPTGFIPKLPTAQADQAAGGAQTGFKPLFGVQPRGNGSTGGFFAQFAQAAKKTEEAEKNRHKAEDFDSDEENEQEWEAKYERERQEKRAKIEAAAEAAKNGFSFIPSINEPRPTGLTSNQGQSGSAGFTLKFGQANSTGSIETATVSSANKDAEEPRKRKADHFDHDIAVKVVDKEDEHQEKRMRRETDASSASEPDNGTQNGDAQLSLKIGQSTGSGTTKSTLLHPSFAQSMTALRSQTTSPAPSIFEEARSSNRPNAIRSDNIFGYLSNQNSDVEDADAKALAAASDDDDIDEDATRGNGVKESTGPSDNLLNKVANDETPKSVQPRPLFASAFQSFMNDGTTTPMQSTPRSDGLFGRISRDEANDPSQSIGRSGKRLNYVTAAESTGQMNPTAPSDATSEPADSTNGVGDNTWKPDLPIKFGSTPKPATSQGSSILAAAAAKSPFVFTSASSGQSALTSAFNSAPTSRAISPAASNLGTNEQESTDHDGKSLATESPADYAVTESLASESQAGDVDGDDDERMGLDKDLEGHNVRWEGEDVKAYRFDVVKKKWALKGVGPMFLLENEKTKVVTILMKKRPSGGIVLNTRLDSKFDYTLAKDVKCVQFPVADSAGIRSWMIRFHDAEESQKFMQEAEAGKTWHRNLQGAENEEEL